MNFKQFIDIFVSQFSVFSLSDAAIESGQSVHNKYRDLKMVNLNTTLRIGFMPVSQAFELRITKRIYDFDTQKLSYHYRLH